VLKHHPDKKAGAVGDSNDDSFFKCIQKAFETLSNPEKRRQWDSVDPVATAEDDSLVPIGKVEPGEFFETWAPIFEREVRLCAFTWVAKKKGHRGKGWLI
jgi:DnaJ homolog subfamily C member 2